MTAGALSYGLNTHTNTCASHTCMDTCVHAHMHRICIHTHHTCTSTCALHTLTYHMHARACTHITCTVHLYMLHVCACVRHMCCTCMCLCAYVCMLFTSIVSYALACMRVHTLSFHPEVTGNWQATKSTTASWAQPREPVSMPGSLLPCTLLPSALHLQPATPFLVWLLRGACPDWPQCFSSAFRPLLLPTLRGSRASSGRPTSPNLRSPSRVANPRRPQSLLSNWQPRSLPCPVRQGRPLRELSPAHICLHVLLSPSVLLGQQFPPPSTQGSQGCLASSSGTSGLP